MKLLKPSLDLAYCTNIHPAESWEETRRALEAHTLEVKSRLVEQGTIAVDDPYAIGLRLSARAASELLDGQINSFKKWLEIHNCYIFTINGFPYGSFHGTRVKEKVYAPDWATQERLDYTRNLFKILTYLTENGTSASVSTLPGSFKGFNTDSDQINVNLLLVAIELEKLSEKYGVDFHLGLEPEPLGLFENTSETLEFFDRLLDQNTDSELLKRRLGINYDTCHFAIEYEDAFEAIGSFQAEGLRISKIHASNALSLDPRNPAAREVILKFEEPTYLHQVIAKIESNSLMRFRDLPDLFSSPKFDQACQVEEWRVHFHIPLFANPMPPLGSTKGHVADVCRLAKEGKLNCSHWEFETYTWGVLPEDLQAPVVDQLCQEYDWLLRNLSQDYQ